MKYIKAFEAATDHLWLPIGGVEFYMGIYGTTEDFDISWLEFTKSEISEIEHIIESPFRLCPIKRKHFIRSDNPPPKGCLKIYKIEDEWFYVSFSDYATDTSICEDDDDLDIHFKCDQLYGLIECLRYLKKNYMDR